MQSAHIRGHLYYPGHPIKCYFNNGQILEGFLHFANNSGCEPRYWICHNNEEKNGNPSPELYGCLYSWTFIYDAHDDSFDQGIRSIEPLVDTSHIKKNVSLTKALENITLSIDYATLVRSAFWMSHKPFENFTSYDVSNKDGFIKLSGEFETPNGKQIKNVEVKLVRFLRKAYDESKVSDKMLERIHNKFVSLQNLNKVNVKFLCGQEILQAYDSKNFCKDSKGTLHKSCMVDKPELLNIYVENSQQVRVACIITEDKIESRCLVWQIGDKFFFDRVYYSYEWIGEILKTKLKELGYVDLIELQNSSKFRRKYIKIKLQHTKFDLYPYMDSFKNLNTDTGELYCINTDSCLAPGKYLFLQGTRGNVETFRVSEQEYEWQPNSTFCSEYE